jgi:hypothetical protein
MVTEIDTSKLVDTQRFNIRIDLMTAFKEESFRELAKRKGPVIEHFTQWRNRTLYFMKNCPFDLICDYPDLPPYHNPNASGKSEELL